MRNLAIIVVAALTLVVPVLSVAGDQPADAAAKPSSFVPHAHSKQHVYGAPIPRPIVGRAKTAHHKHAPNK
jgi:hypothetical protein